MHATRDDKRALFRPVEQVFGFAAILPHHAPFMALGAHAENESLEVSLPVLPDDKMRVWQALHTHLAVSSARKGVPLRSLKL